MPSTVEGLRIRELDGLDWGEIRPQLHGERRVAGRYKTIERRPDRVVVYTEYDPGLVIERHSHLANEIIHVLDGEVMLGERRCPAGTVAILDKGTPIGPIVAGPRGTVLFEAFDGEPGHVSEDYEGFLRLIQERGIEILPEPDTSVPAQGSR